MTIQSRVINVLDMKIHLLTAGSKGPLVILLHGGGIDYARLSWEPLMLALEPFCRVYAPDLPGYGDSAQPDVTYSIQYNIDFLAVFLNELSIERASLVGVSMGGAIAIGTTLNNPQSVEKLVLVDSYGLQSKAPMHKLSYLFVRVPGISQLTWAMIRNRPMVRWTLQALLRKPGAVTDELVEMTLKQVLRPKSSQAFSTLQTDDITWNGLKTCYMDRLAEIRAQTLLIHGTKDGLVPPSCSLQASQLIPGAQLHWMQGCGHWPQRDNPQEFNQVVKDFLLE